MVAITSGVRSSYTNTDINKRNIADVISICSPEDVPFLKLVGWSSAAALMGEEGIYNTKAEWIEDQLRPTSETLTGATSWTNSTTTTTFTAVDGDLYRKGHVLKVDDELMWVSGVSSTTVTVTRGLGGTTPTTHSSEATVEFVGIAQLEGDDPPDGIQITPTVPYNYTQIFEDTVQVTGTELQVKKYGLQNVYNYRREKVMKELPIMLERACFHGGRAVGSATTPRLMGGLDTFVTGIYNASAAVLTRKMFEDQMQDIFEDVGAAHMPKVVICNAWAKRKFSSFYEGSVRTSRDEKRGGVIINTIDTEFGSVDLVLNRWCPSNALYILNTDYIGVGPLGNRTFKHEKLAKTKDAEKGHILGEYTLVVKNAVCHRKIYGFSTTS